jgi:hypothetical protein
MSDPKVITPDREELAATIEAQGRELAPVTTQSVAHQIATTLREAALNPAVDADKMEKILNMQERILDRSAKDAFTRAFDQMQGLLPHINKRGQIVNNSGAVQSRYAKWEDLHRAVMPVLHQFGFTLSFRVGEVEGKSGILTVNAILTHVEGHTVESGAMPLPADASGAKNAVQGVGSTMSYGKRYTTIAILNIVTEDDADGRPPEGGDEAVNKAEELLKAEAETAAGNGTKAYEEFFKAQTRAAKLTIVNRGWHEGLKKRAAEADTKPKASAPAPKKSLDALEQALGDGDQGDIFPGDRK